MDSVPTLIVLILSSLITILCQIPVVWTEDFLLSPEDDKILEENVDISTEDLNEKARIHNVHLNDSFDNHKYYKSQFRLTNDYWVNLTDLNETHGGIVRENSLLANSYRQAATINLSFKFPFYGHDVTNITIATGGFLYTGDHVHSWLAATHYIAPLMANFDLRRGDAEIKYADNGTAFIVEWNSVYLNESTEDEGASTTSSGPFSFQAIIHSSGDIVFAYKDIATNISNIEDKSHPVKVGLSDAYTIDKSVLYVRRKTIYEYHRINLFNSSIVNSSAIIFMALPTCNIQKDCESCISFNDVNKVNNGVDFRCTWCPSVGRCSDGMDRYLQKWLGSECHHHNVSTSAGCSLSSSKYTPYNIHHPSHERTNSNIHFEEDLLPNSSSSNAQEQKDKVDNDKTEEEKEEIHRLVHADLVVVILVGLLVLLMCIWFAYAYIYPHTWSGQLLIKYRPNQWQWRRSEPRYTAASIHM